MNRIKTVHLEKINNFITISDVHLCDPNDAFTQLFINELNKITDVDAVFLMGDIFDFIAVQVSFFLKHWKNVFDAFKKLKERNIKVYFMEGNHDFGFEHFTHPRFSECFTKCGDFEITFNHDKYGYILIKHGDDVMSDNRYRAFRRIVKSRILQSALFFLLSGKLIDLVFSYYAKLSRKQDYRRALPHTSIFKKIEDFINTYHIDCDVCIMGHIHHDIDQNIQTKKNTRVLIGKAWLDTPNFLIVRENEICRKLLNQNMAQN